MLFSRTKKIFTIVLLVSVVFLGACSGSRRSKHISQNDLKNLPRFDIPVEVNDRVIAWIEYFTGSGRRHFQRYLERSGRYKEMMQDILEEEGVPRDLIYIAMIESGFNSQAYSHAHAVGYWQFIKSTGNLYGLKVSAWEDDRRDPYKSTRAAAKLFRDLYNDYGDWYIAMVGYNAGPGRVRRAYKATGVMDYWTWTEHRRALRAETRDYVPKFIAAAIIAKMPERFGFTDIKYKEPFDYEETSVETQTDLKVIAECAGVDKEEIVILNAHLYNGATPPVKNYTIRVPKGTKEKFNKRYAKLPEDKRIRIVYHRVKRGDTLGGIARRYGVGVTAIARANNIRNYRRISIGKKLVIPLHGSKYRSASNTKKSSRKKSSKKAISSSKSSGDITHKVRSGETLFAISNKYGVRTKDLMAWNKIKNPRRVRAGSKLVIKGKGKNVDASDVDTPVKLSKISKKASVVANDKVVKTSERKKTIYTVKSGETLSGIANRNNATVAELKKWNKISNVRRVRAGSKLVIYSDKAGSVAVVAPKSSPIKSASVESPKVISETKAVKVKNETTAFYKYKVKSGETIGGIANRHNVTKKELMSWNNIKNPRSVRADSYLKIKRSKKNQSVVSTPKTSSVNVASEVVASEPSKIPAGSHYYVKSGDTLWEIARRHNVSISELQSWNNLKDPSSVRPGTKLTIKRN